MQQQRKREAKAKQWGRCCKKDQIFDDSDQQRDQHNYAFSKEKSNFSCYHCKATRLEEA